MHLKSWTQTRNQFFFTGESFLRPPTLYYVDEEGTVEHVQSEREFFNPEPFAVMRHETISNDGTRVPYFIVEPRNMKLDGTNPTLLYGYGAVGSPQLPWYDPVVGTAWMERGGVYVVANIRGGGEFGPDWHQSAVRENRQRTFDDFIAVAEDLIARNITAPKHLGIMGHSGGGLLVGAVFVQQPDLFSAVACLNPVLDMKQNRLLEEYGDPDNPDDWFYMKQYSPYHNISSERSYPRVLFFSSTTDDRVNPGQARKMAAKMEDMGHEVFLYETDEGGHGGAVSPSNKAFRDALIYTYFLEQLE
jgi:prolyl oligopeptidase